MPMAPQSVGGADTGGFGPSLQIQPGPQARGLSQASPDAEPTQEKKAGLGGLGEIASEMGGLMGGGNSGMMSGGAGFTSGASAGGGVMFAAKGGPLTPGFTVVGEEGPEGVAMDQSGNAQVIPNTQLPPALGGMGGGPLDQIQGIAGPVSMPGQGPFGSGAKGPIEQGGDKPTSFADIAFGADDEQKEEMAAQIEKQAGPGGLKGAFKRITDVLGAKTPELKLERKEMALYVAEVALRAMSKRSDPRYADNPDGVFADAVLETQAERDAKSEKARLENKADAETRRKETREDAKDEKVYTRGRADKEADHTRDRKEKIEDDERNHKQALELARMQAKLLRERGQRTSIQVGDDGELKLIDLETGEAVTVTETEEVTETRGSRGKGTSTTTKKVKKPVKASPKYNAGGLDDDTRVNRISDAEKAMRADKKLMRELRSKMGNDTVKIEAELRRMAREKVEGDVQSLGAGSSGTIDFNELK
jgi:hypothetical protein